MAKLGEIILFCMLVLDAGGTAAAADLGFETTGQQLSALIGSVHLHNTGSAPTGEIEILMYLPRNLAGQRIFSLDFITPPVAVEEDLWAQKLARWKVRLQPGAHFFATWVARAATADVRFDLDRLRRPGSAIPLPIRSLYLWNAPEDNLDGQYVDLAQALAAYVRRACRPSAAGPPFTQAIPQPPDTFALADTMTTLCHANEVPCRTVGAYVSAGTGEFFMDKAGTAWNEVFFPQSGWVPMSVSDPQEFGRRRAERIVVRTAGHAPENAITSDSFWGRVTGGGDSTIVTHRGYFVRIRNTRAEDETLAAVKSLAQTADATQAAAKLAAISRPGSLAIALLEPWLYRREPGVAEAAAAAIAASRHRQAALILASAMGQAAALDKALAAYAEALTGQAFGTRREDWLAWIRKEMLPSGH